MARTPRTTPLDPDVEFRQGQDAARRLVRVLAVPDRAAQLAAARVLVEAEHVLADRIGEVRRQQAES